ncbi:MAG: hypothetical protein WBL81_25200, partial [Pseudolabrys sp.]
GWFSYQTRREFVDIELHQKNIANLKAWCQYHPQEGVMAGLQRGIGPQSGSSNCAHIDGDLRICSHRKK